MRIGYKATLFKTTSAAFAAGLLLAGCATGPRQRDADAAAVAVEPAEEQPLALEPAEMTRVEDLAEKWGVQIVGLPTTSGGYMLDFRFRVLDAKKAAPLFVR